MVIKNKLTHLATGITLGGGSGILFIDGLIRLADGSIAGAVQILAALIGIDLAKDCFNKYSERSPEKQSDNTSQPNSIVTMYIPRADKDKNPQ